MDSVFVQSLKDVNRFSLQDRAYFSFHSLPFRFGCLCGIFSINPDLTLLQPEGSRPGVFISGKCGPLLFNGDIDFFRGVGDRNRAFLCFRIDRHNSVVFSCYGVYVRGDPALSRNRLGFINIFCGGIVRSEGSEINAGLFHAVNIFDLFSGKGICILRKIVPGDGPVRSSRCSSGNLFRRIVSGFYDQVKLNSRRSFSVLAIPLFLSLDGHCRNRILNYKGTSGSTGS